MVEQDRHCLEELQQVNAAIAAMHEVVLLISSQHLAAGVEHAAGSENRDAVLGEVMLVLRAAIVQT